MNEVQDQKGYDAVIDAETVLFGWHHLSIEHGSLSGRERSQLHRQVMTVWRETSRSRPCEVSLLGNSVEIVIGPPDGQSGIEAIVDAVVGNNDQCWDISYWVE